MEDFIGEKECKKMKFQKKKCYRRYFGGLSLVKEVKKA